ncbi:50S ribosomal protein L22 [bacterium K02(2017)]|nr:50S ribosomal protein L22 [bacterium K02(2017)]
MEFTAKQNNIRVSPQKLRLLVDLVRGKNVQKAIDEMHFSTKKLSKTVEKLLKSAVNNASQSRGVNLDNLYVKRAFVGKGPTMKRFMTRARGGASNILKRSSHITVILDEKQ